MKIKERDELPPRRHVIAVAPALHAAIREHCASRNMVIRRWVETVLRQALKGGGK